MYGLFLVSDQYGEDLFYVSKCPAKLWAAADRLRQRWGDTEFPIATVGECFYGSFHEYLNIEELEEII